MTYADPYTSRGTTPETGDDGREGKDNAPDTAHSDNEVHPSVEGQSDDSVVITSVAVVFSLNFLLVFVAFSVL